MIDPKDGAFVDFNGELHGNDSLASELKQWQQQSDDDLQSALEAIESGDVVTVLSLTARIATLEAELAKEREKNRDLNERYQRLAAMAMSQSEDVYGPKPGAAQC